MTLLSIPFVRIGLRLCFFIVLMCGVAHGEENSSTESSEEREGNGAHSMSIMKMSKKPPIKVLLRYQFPFAISQNVSSNVFQFSMRSLHRTVWSHSNNSKVVWCGKV